ncbi:DUF302 domain-containing protein [Maricaulis sp. CAU 1757]
MRLTALILVLIPALALTACQRVPKADGVIVRESPHSVAETVDRLEALANSLGANVVARVDHAANAAGTGTQMRPSMVVIFGNPAMGTPLIERSPTAGLDLPVRVLVWQDEDNDVWLAYTDPEHIARRHGIDREDSAVARMVSTLNSMANSVLAEDDRD